MTIVINLHSLWWILPWIVTILALLWAITVVQADYNEGSYVQGLSTVLALLITTTVCSIAWLIGVLCR